jgi:hypothetical protein
MERHCEAGVAGEVVVVVVVVAATARASVLADALDGAAVRDSMVLRGSAQAEQRGRMPIGLGGRGGFWRTASVVRD